MSPQRALRATAARFDQRRRATASTPPGWLGLTWVVWAVTAILALGILAASIPGYAQVASQGDWIGLVVEAPAGLVHALDLTGALASFAAALVCLALAGLLFWRKPRDGMALFVSLYLLVYGSVLAGPLERVDVLVPGAAALATDVLQPLILTWPTVALLVLFPTGRLAPPWSRWLLLLTIAFTPLVVYTSHLGWTSANWLIWPTSIYLVLTLGAAGYAQAFRYRRLSSVRERQQTKWVVSGVTLSGLLLLINGAPYILLLSMPPDAALPWWAPVSALGWWLALAIVPLALTVALLRYRLFDINVLIRQTLIYGTLTAILGAIYVAVVLGGQSVVRALTSETGDEPVVIVASTLLVAALATRLRRRIQATIDRRFYRRKYNAARTLAAFSLALRAETDLGALSAQLMTIAEETMQPASVSLWLRAPARLYRASAAEWLS